MENASGYLERLEATGLLPGAKITELRADGELIKLPSKQLAAELVRRKVLSKYQSRAILRSAHAKFDYGDYRVVGRHTDGFRTGLFQAVHRTSGKRVEFDRVKVGMLDLATEMTYLRHANLVSCLEVFEAGGQAIVVFEPVVGDSLANAIGRGSLTQNGLPMAGRASEGRASQGSAAERRAAENEVSESGASGIVRQVAEACWELHSHGLSHGLICSAAVVLDASQNAKLLWRPGRSIDDDDAVGERLRDLAVPFSCDGGQATGWEFEADVYSLGKLLEQLTDHFGAAPDHIAKIVQGATRSEDRFSHAGVVAALLSSSGDVGDQHANVKWAPPASDASPTGPSLGLSTDGGSQADRLRARQASRGKQLLWGGAAALSIALLTVVGGWLLTDQFQSGSQKTPSPVNLATARQVDPGISDSTESRGTESRKNTLVSGGENHAKDDAEGGGQDDSLGEATDDGESLWQSPTSGSPIDFSPLPPNSQLYISFRPAAILFEKQSLRALNALGPEFQSNRRAWEESIGVQWEDLDTLAAAVLASDAGAPEVCWLLRPRDGWEPPPSWLHGRTEQILDQTLVQIRDRFVWDRFVWDSGNGFVIGSRTTVRTSIESRNATSLLRRELEQVRLCTDEQQLMSTLFVPRFLATEGRKLTSLQTRPLMASILKSMGDETRACGLGLHVNEDQFFGELRFVAGGDGGAARKARDFRERLRQLPSRTEEAIATLPVLDGYWRRLALRSVQMMQFAEQHFRIAPDRRCVVANVSLPPAAAHNLFMAVELVTASTQSESTNRSSAAPSSRKVSMERILQQRMSVDIPQQSIEFALREIADQINEGVDASSRIKIQIDGPALQAAGITRNQQIREFRRNDATLAEILTGMVMKANPVTTVKSSAELDQKLIWVRVDEPSRSGRRIILITTRTVATEKNYSLPSEFRQK